MTWITNQPGLAGTTNAIMTVGDVCPQCHQIHTATGCPQWTNPVVRQIPQWHYYMPPQPRLGDEDVERIARRVVELLATKETP